MAPGARSTEGGEAAGEGLGVGGEVRRPVLLPADLPGLV